MGLFGPPNVEKMKAKRDVKGLIKALGYTKDSSVREAAAKALGGIKDARAVEPLIASLTESDWNVRRAAAGALGQIGDVRAIEPLLVVALSNAYVEDRKASADALEQLGWIPGMDENGARYWVAKQNWDRCVEIGTPAVELLITALKQADQYQQWQVAYALGKLSDTRAVAPLIDSLKTGHHNTREAAIVALGQLGDARAVAPLIPMLTDYSERVRTAAIKALRQISDACAVDAVEPLITNLKLASGKSDDDKFVREVVTDILIKVGPPAVEPLIALLEEQWYLKCLAANALGEIKDPRAVQPLSELAISSDDDYPVKALIKIGEPAIEGLIAVLKDGTRSGCRVAAANGLGEIGGTQAVEPLLIALSDIYNDDVRLAASASLEKLGWQPGLDERAAAYWITKRDWDKCIEIGISAIEPLVLLLKESFSPRDRVAMASAIAKIGDVSSLIAMLEEKNFRGSEDVIFVLGQIGDTRAIESLIDALEYGARKAAVDALVKIGEPAVRSLIAALKDRCEFGASQFSTDWAGTEALDKIGWQPGNDVYGAAYWITKRRYDKCVEIGSPAIELLFTASTRDVAAAEALGRLGDSRAIELLFTASKRDVAAAKALGLLGDSRAIASLTALLGSSSKGDRRGAAQALVALYHSQGFDERTKQLILSQRNEIVQPHTDDREHTDRTEYQRTTEGCEPTSHSDRWYPHIDSGIGVDFPL